ncbi:MAG: hypothetical protein EOP07_17825 [Proteobacteria bacterium]|nr:MAG: hypothetical protein EOP07_17825 [Pseudomonadota bacterium]
MVSRVGDSLFNRDGKAGFIVARDPKKETLQVATEGPEFEKGRRYGFINGLEPKQRQEFEQIIDTMRDKTETRERVDFLHEQIETLKQDPKRGVLTRYLQGEMAHIMNSEGVTPRIYSIDETKT